VRTNVKTGSVLPRVRRRESTRSKSKETTESAASSADTALARDEISRLAYLHWEARGGIGGSAEDDWYRAEQEILALGRALER
jgi:hypothetical protein